MRALLAGESTPVLTAAFLTALRMKGETVDELTGFARAMRAAALRRCRSSLRVGRCSIPAAPAATASVDVQHFDGRRVRGGGRGRARGQAWQSVDFEPVRQRGCCWKRSACGRRSTPEMAARAIREVGIGFLFAPAFHGATRHVQPVRLELKMRTAFNFLGPLTNPARAEIQVAGTWSEEAAEKIAGALARLGLQRGYVVHGSDGLGELTITGPAMVFDVRDGCGDTDDAGAGGFRDGCGSALRLFWAETRTRNRAIAEWCSGW